jgi:hypothetical protein
MAAELKVPAGPPDTSAAQLADAAAALFEQARRRARRRRQRAAFGGLALVLIAAGVALVVVRTHDRSAPTRPGAPTPVTVTPERVLALPSYLGVSCRRANSIACDRVGLAIWTRSSVRAVRATIAGRSFDLTDDPRFVGPHQRAQPHMFIGFLHHAGLRHGALAVRVENGRNRWTGKHPVHATMRLVITLADRSRMATSANVRLSPGWG